jgi:hypothetical protein
MRPIGDITSTALVTTQIVAARSRASQKLKPASGLHAQLGDDAHSGMRSHQSQSWTALCHSGTDRSVPSRYGMEAPQLNAAFVAQLLGQALPDRAPRPAGALAAYEEIVPTALLCDTRL